FGVALSHKGAVKLKLSKHAKDLNTIDPTCPCPTCTDKTTRAVLHRLLTHETAGAHAETIHNITFQAQVMGRARNAIIEGRFPEYLK
ncbi:hypothetical protein MPER_15848, partial [Moniliophthora perniciosa FA553]